MSLTFVDRVTSKQVLVSLNCGSSTGIGMFMHSGSGLGQLQSVDPIRQIKKFLWISQIKVIIQIQKPLIVSFGETRIKLGVAI